MAAITTGHKTEKLLVFKKSLQLTNGTFTLTRMSVHFDASVKCTIDIV